jgi:diguanylate cyclase (GGDEF)-like protein
MLQLINHIARTSAQRDRTQVNDALVDAMEDLFHPKLMSIYRVYAGTHKTMVFDCAGIGTGGRYLRNAYLPESTYSYNIEFDPLLLRAQTQRSVVYENLPDDIIRVVFYIAPVDRPLYLIDITIQEALLPKQRAILIGIVEYFTNHVALLDYGETDTLTGLPNRKTFDKHLYEVLSQAANDEAQRSDSTVVPKRRKGNSEGSHWLAVFDIDHFKLVNDNFGHLIGDEVLVMFARLIRESFRFQDQIFRFGGEEFIVVLQPTDTVSVQKIFERFRLKVESHIFSQVGRVTVSIGYSRLTIKDTPPNVIDRADEALYYVKQHGRNNVGNYEELVSTGKLSVSKVQTGDVELF